MIGQDTAPSAGAPPRSYRAAPPIHGRRVDPGRLGAGGSTGGRFRGLLAYWYVPVAGLLAVGVAVAVIIGIDLLAGGGDNDDEVELPAGAAETPDPTPTDADSPGSTPTATLEAGEPTSTPTATPATGRFENGATVFVTGTGDCLRVRSGAGLASAVVDCVPDGTALTILQGPEASDDLDWWLVEAPQSQGWAADLYFAEAP